MHQTESEYNTFNNKSACQRSGHIFEGTGKLKGQKLPRYNKRNNQTIQSWRKVEGWFIALWSKIYWPTSAIQRGNYKMHIYRDILWYGPHDMTVANFQSISKKKEWAFHGRGYKPDFWDNSRWLLGNDTETEKSSIRLSVDGWRGQNKFISLTIEIRTDGRLTNSDLIWKITKWKCVLPTNIQQFINLRAGGPINYDEKIKHQVGWWVQFYEDDPIHWKDKNR